MKETWIISDTHFYHNNIIKYCNRPFNCVDDMNKTLINNWNSLIKKEENVIILGDFAFKFKNNNLGDLVKQLNGNKLLILGNHDNESPKKYRTYGFDEVSKYPIIYEGFYILSHEPVFLNEKNPYVNIHGHTHQMSPVCLNCDGINLYYNVCVELHNYKPVKFQSIKKLYNAI